MCVFNNKGLTFLEIIVAFFIFSVTMVGFFQIFNTALDSSYRASRKIIAINLARGLMAEVMTKDFVEPGSGDPPPALGPDGTETRFGSSGSVYDDVDDYDGLIETPPRTIDNLAMDGTAGTPDYSDFSRSVSVVYIDEVGGTFQQVAGPTDYKQITVTVSGPYLSDTNIDEVKVNLP
jgi:type II secretory pathway pseudopilin PulG